MSTPVIEITLVKLKSGTMERHVVKTRFAIADSFEEALAFFERVIRLWQDEHDGPTGSGTP